MRRAGCGRVLATNPSAAVANCRSVEDCTGHVGRSARGKPDNQTAARPRAYPRPRPALVAGRSDDSVLFGLLRLSRAVAPCRLARQADAWRGDGAWRLRADQLHPLLQPAAILRSGRTHALDFRRLDTD